MSHAPAMNLTYGDQSHVQRGEIQAESERNFVAGGAFQNRRFAPKKLPLPKVQIRHCAY